MIKIEKVRNEHYLNYRTLYFNGKKYVANLLMKVDYKR